MLPGHHGSRSPPKTGTLSLLSQRSTDFSGKYYELAGAYCEPKGPQRPHPPICIGGNGERRTLRTVARYAQHWNFVHGVPGDAKAEREMVDLFTRKRDVLYGHCQDIGRDPSEITVSAHVFLGPDGPGPVADTIAPLAERGLDLAIVYVPVPHDPGVLAPLAETLAPLR